MVPHLFLILQKTFKRHPNRWRIPSRNTVACLCFRYLRKSHDLVVFCRFSNSVAIIFSKSLLRNSLVNKLASLGFVTLKASLQHISPWTILLLRRPDFSFNPYLAEQTLITANHKSLQGTTQLRSFCIIT